MKRRRKRGVVLFREVLAVSGAAEPLDPAHSQRKQCVFLLNGLEHSAAFIEYKSMNVCVVCFPAVSPHLILQSARYRKAFSLPCSLQTFEVCRRTNISGAEYTASVNAGRMSLHSKRYASFHFGWIEGVWLVMKMKWQQVFPCKRSENRYNRSPKRGVYGGAEVSGDSGKLHWFICLPVRFSNGQSLGFTSCCREDLFAEKSQVHFSFYQWRREIC